MCCGKTDSTVQTAGATVRRPNQAAGLEPVPFVKTLGPTHGGGAPGYHDAGGTERALARNLTPVGGG